MKASSIPSLIFEANQGHSTSYVGITMSNTALLEYIYTEVNLHARTHI